MKVLFFSFKKYESNYYEIFKSKHQVSFLDVHLSESTVSLVKGFDVVSVFVNDHLNREVIRSLKDLGVKLIALRCAGYNNVDLKAAREFGMPVVRVPKYSPYAVAEHALALIMMLNRKIHKAYNRIRDGNFTLDGLIGFDLHKKTVGVIGTGEIGQVFCQIMNGLGCKVLAYDIQPSSLENVKYVTQEELFRESDIISLHVPLTNKTHHMVNAQTFKITKPNLMLINTGRGGLIDSKALLQALKQQKIGYAGLDVYEEEENVFFEDLSASGYQDDILARLTTFPNVVVTSHQGFLTHEALINISQTTLQNITSFENGKLENCL